MNSAARKLSAVAGLVFGGTALGAMLGAHVDPVPRQPAQEEGPRVRGAVYEPSPSWQFVDAGPEDLSPPTQPGGFAPDWAESGDTPWQYPEPVVEAWEPVPFPTLAELDAQFDEQRALLDAAAAAADAAVLDAERAQAARAETVLPPEPRRDEDMHLAAIY